MIEYEVYHAHSCYSNCLTQPDSTMFIKDYAKVYRERGHKVLCLSEHGNRSNVWEQFDICESFKNDKTNPYTMTPLAAAEVYFVPDRKAEIDGKRDARNFHLILVAKNQEGFYELNEILSEANISGYYYHARVDFDLLGQLNYKNFMCTTACFVKGTKVKTRFGWKPIEDINSDDFILNMFGEWEKVNFPTSRQYIGAGKRIYVRGQEHPIECTDEHKFLTITCGSLNYYNTSGKDPRKWIEAKHLSDNKSMTSKPILLEPIINKEYCNTRISIEKEEWKNKLIHREYSSKNPIHEKIDLTPEVMRFFGLWLGDGSISVNEEAKYYNVSITFNYEDFDCYWDGFVKKASEEIGISWSINERPEYNRIDLSSHNLEFVEMMHFLFGNQKALSKHIPDILLGISNEFDLNIVFGLMLSDGSFTTRVKESYQYGFMTFVSVSEELTNQIKSILEDNQIRTGKIHKTQELTEKDGVHHKEAYYLKVSNNAFIGDIKHKRYANDDVINLFDRAKTECSNIVCEIEGVKYRKRYIERIDDIDLSTTVHCLNVNSHSFVCENVIVHNCVAGITKDENYERLACQLGEIFRENFYLEVQHHPQEIQKETNMKILRLYQKYRWPLIYGTDSHYVNKSDKILRTELMLSKGISYGDEDSFDLHLPTAQESYQLLLDQEILSRAQIEEAMENTLILREFEGVSFSKEKKIPNAYPGMTIEERNNLYKTTCMNEYIRKAGVPTEEEAKELQEEMDAVADTGTADYFLLCKRIVDKGKEYGGVITKTGRGSGSSFATNFSLGFTSLNRLHSPVKLYPERFISKERMAAGILPD